MLDAVCVTPVDVDGLRTFRSGVRVTVVESVGDVGVVHARGQRGTVCAHQAGDVRSGHLTFGEQLEGAQHGVVEERTALHHHGVAQLAGIAQLDHLIQRVAHHGIAQAGRDVLHRGAFLLRLLDGGVHEHGAARAQVDGMCGVERGLRELLDRQSHGLCKGLQERTAAGRTGLVDGDRVDHTVGDRQVFHVLAADVDDGGNARRDHFRTAIMGHGLHHALVQMQAGGDQSLAVSGGAGACYPRAFRQLALNLLDDVDSGRQRAAFVGGVRRPYDFAVVVDERRFDGGRSGVDAEEVRALRAFQRADVHMLAVVALVERLTVRFGREQRRHGRGVGRQVLQVFKAFQRYRRRCVLRNAGPPQAGPVRRRAARSRTPRTGARRSAR